MVRYKPSQFTKRELEIMVSALALDKGLDFMTGGKLNQYGRKAAIKIVKTTLPLALRIGGSVGVSTARAAVPLVTNPYLAGTALGLGALQTQPGQELLEAASERGRMDRIRFEQALTDLTVGAGKVKTRTKSKFNNFVSKGMSTIKQSTSYGKKGVINAPKKAFKVVVAAASAVSRGKKVPKSGIKRKLMTMMRKLR
jgi:hypothetical protein